MTIPLWIWPAIALACLWLLAWHECREANRKANNFRAVEAERLARKYTAPFGNVDRKDAA